jgi:hypothetical protein
MTAITGAGSLRTGQCADGVPRRVFGKVGFGRVVCVPPG